MTHPRAAWHALAMEDPIEPELPICDTHHHLWDHGPQDRYLLDELLADIASGHNVVSTVYVDAHSMYRASGPEEMKPVGEVEFANGVAAMSASGIYGKTRVAAGIVSHADLTLGSRVQAVLEAQIAASPRRYRGIRYWTTWDEDPVAVQLVRTAPRGLALDRGFREGIACLDRLGLAFDAWMLFHQLPDCADLARAFPNLAIVLEHAGGLVRIGPYAGRAEVFEVWKRNLAEVAKCPNVYVKLGGAGVPRAGFGWHTRAAPPGSAQIAAAIRPWYLHAIECFGPRRCMFESNFPVDGASFSYPVIWNAFKRLTADFSPSERAAMFHDTAVAAYRLQEI